MTITKSTVSGAGYAALIAALECKPAFTFGACDDVETELHDIIDDDYNYEAYTVDYYHEAWDIVTDSDFNCEPQDFSGCETALDCIMQEANASLDDVVREGWEEAFEEAKAALEELVTVAREMGLEDVRVNFTGSSSHGWAVHNRETESGLCIYDDKEGFYNPEKLEGECYALESSFGGMYISACWTPEDE